MDDTTRQPEMSARSLRLRTSTSASAGWAARLEARIGHGAAVPSTQASTLARTTGSRRTASDALSSLRA